MKFEDSRLPRRFWSKVAPCPMSGCWVWTGAVTGAGYGSFCVNGSTPSAHRTAFAAAFGSPGPGLVLDHRCRVRCCVNPLHLEAITPRDNTLRGVGGSAVNASRDACVNGHAFDSFNTRTGRNHRGRPNRRCRACERDRARLRQSYKGTWVTRCGICGEVGHSRRHHDRHAQLRKVG